MSDFINSYGSLNYSGKLLSMLSTNQMNIVNNLSNLDNPNFTRKETNFNQVLSTMRSPLETDLAKKMGPGPVMKEGQGPVVLEQELMNMQRNWIFYSMTTRRMSSFITAIKQVAGVGR